MLPLLLLLLPPRVSLGRQEGMGLRPGPVFRLQEARGQRLCPPEFCKQKCRASEANMSAQHRALEGAGRRFATPGPGLDPQGGRPWPPLACLAKRGVVSPDAASTLVFLAFPQQPRVWPLPSPRSRWPLQPGTCSWRVAARKVQTWGSPCVSSESLQEAYLLPGGAHLGLSRWRRS